jgi:hypothetical protein
LPYLVESATLLAHVPLVSRRGVFRGSLGEGGLGVGVGLWLALLRRPPGEECSVVLFGGLADTFLGGTFGAEGGHEGAILAAQDKDVRIRLVQ